MAINQKPSVAEFIGGAPDAEAETSSTGMMRESSSVRLIWSFAPGPGVGG